MTRKTPIQLKPDFTAQAQMEGQPVMILAEASQRAVMLTLSPKIAAEIATGAMQLLTRPADALNTTGDPPPLREVSRDIPVQATGWIPSAKSTAPPGHSTLVLVVGGIQLLFSAPTDNWAKTLQELLEDGGNSQKSN